MNNPPKTVIVTGASQGIGAGIVRAFLARDYNVVGTARNATKSKDLSASDQLVLIDGDIGQDLLVSGQQMGEHIVQLLPNGGEIALFIATPGAANIQPRIDGAKDTLKSHSNIKFDVVATGAAVPAIAVTDTSRVDVSGVAGGDMTKACAVAKQAAQVVEPKLP